MKKYFTMVFVTFLFIVDVTFGETFKVSNSGFSFSPATLTIKAGDEVNFELATMHNAVQVNKNVWDANGSTPNGGFNIPYGGGKVTLNTPGTYYYVCQPHAGSGMKGIIIVSTTTGIPEISGIADNILTVYPNPASQFVTINFNVFSYTAIKLDLIDVNGREVKNLVVSNLSPGNYSRTFPLTGITPGRYLLRYIYSDQRIVAPLIISYQK